MQICNDFGIYMFPPEIRAAQKVVKVCILNLNMTWAINKLQICIIDISSSKLYFWKLQILTIPHVFADQKNLPPLQSYTLSKIVVFPDI